ncbi:MAG: hypothetical protein GX452_13835 [Ignavibacteriales bacterium]|nr:hypothetical protein [Ignavibacteriales bacterium]
MKITTKTNKIFDLEVEGTQEHPVLKVFINGKQYDGMLQHWDHEGLEKGIYINDLNVYAQCEASYPAILKAISDLPKEGSYAILTEQELDADGDKITVQKWYFRNMPFVDVDDFMIGSAEIEKTLDEIYEKTGKTKIYKEEIVDYWLTKNSVTERKQREKAAARRMQAAAEASDGNDYD